MLFFIYWKKKHEKEWRHLWSLSPTKLISAYHLFASSYGTGSRIKLSYTRKIIDAIHSGKLLNANFKKTEVFGLEIPTEIEDVPPEILDPINTVS